MNKFGIQIGEYIIYPAMVLLLLGIAIFITIVFVAFLIATKHKKNKIFKITQWQKEEIPNSFIYIKEELGNDAAINYIEENEQIVQDFENYLYKSQKWDYNQIEMIDPSAPFIISKMLFYDIESSLKDFDDGEERALLLLNTIDMINGGPEYNGKECQWLLEDIEEFSEEGPNSNIKKLKTIFQQALLKILDQMDEKEGKINPIYDLPDYVKKYTREDIYYCIGDLTENNGFVQFDDETKEAIIDGLLLLLNQYFLQPYENVDVIYLCYVRSLVCILDMHTYDEFLKSLQ